MHQLNIPNHIAIIMDGNGRWATQRQLPRTAGHKQGVEAIKKVVERANELGVKIVTAYAFSTENWGRPKSEIDYLMNLPKLFFNSYMKQLMANDVQLKVIGEINGLPDKTQAVIRDALDKTKNNTGLILNIALNYGSQDEIVRAVQKIAHKAQKGQIKIEDIDKNLLANHLDTSFLGEEAAPDLLIRTSGEIRLSNFLLWQLAYSEFYFTDVLWPDFDGKQLDLAIKSYNERQRRFGKL